MTNLTASEARKLIERLHHNQTKEHGISILEEKYLAALEIALTVLEQQESKDVFIVVRKPGHMPYIKRPVGDITDYLIQIYQHNHSVSCDVVTYRFQGPSGQWVQDGKELLAELEVPQPQTDTYRQIENDGWIEWGGGECPVPKGTLVDVRLRDGGIKRSAYAWGQKDDVAREFKASYAGWAFWINEGHAGDIIAYRVIEQQEREQGEEE